MNIWTSGMAEWPNWAEGHGAWGMGNCLRLPTSFNKILHLGSK